MSFTKEGFIYDQVFILLQNRDLPTTRSSLFYKTGIYLRPGLHYFTKQGFTYGQVFIILQNRDLPTARSSLFYKTGIYLRPGLHSFTKQGFTYDQIFILLQNRDLPTTRSSFVYKRGICLRPGLHSFTKQGFTYDQILILLWYFTPLLGVFCPNTRDRVKTSSSRVESPIKNYWELEPVRWNHDTVSKTRAFITSWRGCISKQQTSTAPLESLIIRFPLSTQISDQGPRKTSNSAGRNNMYWDQNTEQW